MPMFSTTGRPQWTKCQDFGNELEASIAVAILDNAGIPSVIRSNDSVGLFGGGFQGFSAMGVSLLVPSPALAAARTVLASARSQARDSATSDETESGPHEPDTR